MEPLTCDYNNGHIVGKVLHVRNHFVGGSAQKVAQFARMERAAIEQLNNALVRTVASARSRKRNCPFDAQLRSVE
jgi:hypothetical protein